MPLKLAGRTHPNDYEYYEQYVEPRLADHAGDIAVVGEAGHEAKLALLRGARALLCPLQWEEPFGLVAIEAMLCGTPVIGFPRGSFPEIIDEGVTGFLVPNGDVEGIARVARDLDRFDRGACARRARDRFSAELMATRYETLYRSLLERRAAVRAA
jgi:glycosyltransferase involved in cell wall biosynthesis